MKKYFTTGLAILLPIIVTIMIIDFFVNFLTQPFLEPTKALILQLDSAQHPFFLFKETTLITWVSKGIILFFLIAFTILIGLIGKLFLIDYLFSVGNYFLHQLPFVNKIYKTCQDIVHGLFSTTSRTFSQVVLVPFPNGNNLIIGLVIRGSVKIQQPQQETKHLISVFIPSTPNPSFGFLLMLEKEHLTFVNMKVNEAIKFVVSCGSVVPNFTIIQSDVSYEKK